jgi:DNA sulfur modification protein DndD
MKIDVLGWESEGLRCPNLNVNLATSSGEPAQVSLIQMPNGTGKTTTLELMKAALNGEARNWDQQRVKRYAQKDADMTLPGKFLIRLQVDSSPLTIELILDFESGGARYFTTAPGSGGRSPGWNPPPSVHRFFSPQFIDLFVFDGELANNLLDSRRAEAERAIDALCQLYLLEEISRFSDSKWEAAAKHGPRTSQGLQQHERKRKTILKQISKINEAKGAAEEKVAELSGNIAELEKYISGHIGGLDNIKEQYQSAELAKKTAENDVQQFSNTLMQHVRQPQRLHQQLVDALTDLKNNLDQLKLPENTSAQFFEELMNEVDCICGREMTDAARDNVKVRSSDYLGADEAGIINAIKHDIIQYSAGLGSGDEDRITTAVADVGNAARDLKMAGQEADTLKKKLIEQGDAELEKWEENLRTYKSEIKDYETLLKSIKEPQQENESEIEKIFSLKQLKGLLGDAEKKISEITGTLALRNQTEVIKGITEQAKLIARNRIRETLLVECNTRLLSVLAHNPVQLEKIDSSLKLEGQDAASVGQTLSVGYTFLMSVLNRGKNEFPLIIDSPAGPLDAARRRVIGELIPELCSQFVGLTISTERLGFVEALEEASNSINYLTIFRKTPGTESLISELPSLNVTQTSNAVMVEGKEYFNQFDLSEEL